MAEPTDDRQNNTVDGGGGESQGSWLDGLPDDLRGNEALRAFEGIDGLAKGYLDLKSSQPVRPESADGYQFDIPDSVPINGEQITAFKALAHEMGLSQEMAAKIVDFDVKRHQAASQARQAAAYAEMEKAETALKQTWGTNYDANLVLANRAVERFGGKELVEHLEKTGLGRHPQTVMAFQKIGAAMSEATFAEGKAHAGSGIQRDIVGQPVLNFPSMDKK